MTKEQEAIERLEQDISAGEYSTTKTEVLETALNMIKQNSAEIQQKNTELAEKNAEIEELKQALARNIAKNFTSSMKESAKSKEDLEMLNKGWEIETEKKDKQIDLMAEFIFQNIDIEENICNSAYVECKQEMAQDITCINCIKQYFERKSEKWKLKLKNMLELKEG